MQDCYCCSGEKFELCCGPILSGDAKAKNAEQLMRSRFSAYCTDNFQYILDTYGAEQRQNLTTEALKSSAGDTRWLGLQVIAFKETSEQTAQVEFVAFYKDAGNVYQMHEISDFELQQQHWKYTTGQMQADSGKIKLSRNAPCPCNSGKKFKQCCLIRTS